MIGHTPKRPPRRGPRSGSGLGDDLITRVEDDDLAIDVDHVAGLDPGRVEVVLCAAGNGIPSSLPGGPDGDTPHDEEQAEEGEKGEVVIAVRHTPIIQPRLPPSQGELPKCSFVR